ncbi:MAG TPA: TadE/TadG family type IV pilus assembly protein [Candidatus Deferrimicrobiaceae bacterium]|nr:TadE/TadG family type IV pilus assembly protein [Candidatus Deferrimicrobiaceae bacterium]
MRRRHLRPGSEGQALTEVALVAPLFFLMLFGIIDLGRVIWANDVVANAAREGARFASVHAGTPALTTEASKDDIREHALGFVIGGGVDPSVTVCFSAVHVASGSHGCSGDVDEASAGYAKGNLVTVVVHSDVPLITGALLGFGTFAVSGESTVLVNN